MPYGKRYEVNLFHGDKDHNVLIHCNGEIIVIDFLVHQTKNYSFCIENHLLKITITLLENGMFEYLLEGESVQYIPPLAEKKSDYLKYSVSFLIIFLFIVLMIWIFSFYRP
jgi:hypothetical protein